MQIFIKPSRLQRFMSYRRHRETKKNEKNFAAMLKTILPSLSWSVKPLQSSKNLKIRL